MRPTSCVPFLVVLLGIACEKPTITPAGPDEARARDLVLEQAATQVALGPGGHLHRFRLDSAAAFRADSSTVILAFRADVSHGRLYRVAVGRHSLVPLTGFSNPDLPALSRLLGPIHESSAAARRVRILAYALDPSGATHVVHPFSEASRDSGAVQEVMTALRSRGFQPDSVWTDGDSVIYARTTYLTQYRHEPAYGRAVSMPRRARSMVAAFDSRSGALRSYAVREDPVAFEAWPPPLM